MFIFQWGFLCCSRCCCFNALIFVLRRSRKYLEHNITCVSIHATSYYKGVQRKLFSQPSTPATLVLFYVTQHQPKLRDNRKKNTPSVSQWCARQVYHGLSNIFFIRKTQRVLLSIPIPPTYLADFFREFLKASSFVLLFLYDVSLSGQAAHEKENPAAAH